MSRAIAAACGCGWMSNRFAFPPGAIREWLGHVERDELCGFLMNNPQMIHFTDEECK